MDIFVYSDESGVFDVIHNDIYVFGGLILLGKEERDVCARKYAHAENVLRSNKSVDLNFELTATKLENYEKSELFRSLNKVYKFGVVIDQKKLLKKIFEHKKTKQRYLDYAYKIALKKALKHLISSGEIIANDVKTIHIFVDEHTTATDGKYELRESIEQEFKYGIFKYDYGAYYPPIFPNIDQIVLKFCDSASVRLIRAADIVANRLYYLAISKQINNRSGEKFYITRLPQN